MSRKSRKRRRKSISDLNITNLVDVVFALLIIFMITAPMMKQGVQVDLPNADAENVENNIEMIQVTVNKESEIYLNEELVSLNRFRKSFEEVFMGNKEVPVFISADSEVPYGIVVRIISEVQNSGAEKLGFLTEPLEK